MRIFNIHNVKDYNKKPIDPVVLDRTHPLANKLRHAFIFQRVGRTPPNAVATSYITFDHQTEMAFGTRNVYHIPYQGRMAGLFNGAGTGIPITNVGLNDMHPLDDKLTVLTRVFYNDHARDHSLFDYNDQGLVIWADFVGTDLGTRIYPGSGGSTGTSGALNTPPWVSWGAVVESDGAGKSDCYSYVNGKFETSALAQGNDGFVGGTRYRFGVNYSGGSKASNAYYEYIYFWDKSLSAEEIREIYERPYQIFKPAIPITYFIPEAVGGPAVIPPRMHNIKNQFSTITASRLGGVLEQ